jgi:hypothetical protein
VDSPEESAELLSSFPRDRQLHGVGCVEHKPWVSPNAGVPSHLREREISFAQVPLEKDPFHSSTGCFRRHPT